MLCHIIAMVASFAHFMHAETNSVLQCNCCFAHSSSALLKIVQLRLPDIEKTYLDLVLQHRARYKQRWVTQ